MFDVNALMQAPVEGAMATQPVPVPEGDHLAVIFDVKGKEASTRDGIKPVLEVELHIDNPALEAELGRKPKLFYTIWLELDEASRLAMGKGRNVDLGRLREAVKQNTPGQPWSITMLKGQPLRVLVFHKPSDDGTKVYANVKSFTSVG